MTEGEWGTCPPTELEDMLNFLSSRKIADRKIWLFACGCCRGIWPLFTDERSRTAVEVAERYADGLATADELEQARGKAEDVIHDSGQIRAISIMAERVARNERNGSPWIAARRVFADLLDVSWQVERFYFTKQLTDRQRREIFDVSSLLREVFGTLPFRPVRIDPWAPEGHEGDVRKMAQAIYAERDFASLPILADALEDAGVVNAEVLMHCREPGRHVRGCWVLDHLLGNK